MQNPTVTDLTIKLDGNEWSQKWRDMVETIVVRVPEKGIARMQLTFTDHERDWDKVTEFGGGTQLEASLKQEDKQGLVFKGEITSIRSRIRVDGGLELTLEGSDRLHRLKRSNRERILNDITDGDLVSKFASEAGMSGQPEDPGIVHSSIIQYGLTNYELLSERAARLGYIFWAENDALHFAPARTQGDNVKLTLGFDLLEMRVMRTAGRVAPEVKVLTWDMMGKAEQVGEAAAGSETLTSQDGQGGLDVVKSSFSDPPLQIGNLVARSQDEADAIALGRLEQSSLGFVVAKGKCRGYPMMMPGSTIELDQVPEDVRGSYVVAFVKHCYDGDGLVSEFEARRNIVP